MAEGFGEGYAEGLQLAQNLQLGEVEKQQKQVQLQQSQLQLDAMQRIQAFAQNKQFQAQLANPNTADQAMQQLQDNLFGSGLYEQGAAVARARSEQQESLAYISAQQAEATSRTAGTILDIFSNVTDEQSLAAAKINAQWALPKDTPSNVRTMIQNMTLAQVPQGKEYIDNIQKRASALAEQKRGEAEAARVQLEQAEAQKDKAQAAEAETRRDQLRKAGAKDLVPTKRDLDEITARLRTEYPAPDEDTLPKDMRGKQFDAAAAKENREARYTSVANSIADRMLELMKAGGKTRQEALDQAFKEAKERKETLVLSNQASATTPAKRVYDPATGTFSNAPAD